MYKFWPNGVWLISSYQGGGKRRGGGGREDGKMALLPTSITIQRNESGSKKQRGESGKEVWEGGGENNILTTYRARDAGSLH